MYLGDILKATFPLDEFENKFDAQKLTAIMNYPDIHKDVDCRCSSLDLQQISTISRRIATGPYSVTEII